MGLRAANPEYEMLGVGCGQLAVLVSRSLQAPTLRYRQLVASNNRNLFPTV